MKWAAVVPRSAEVELALPMPPGPGHYSIMAMGGGDWVAQTIVFYSKDPAPGDTDPVPSGTWSVTITKSRYDSRLGQRRRREHLISHIIPAPNYVLDLRGIF